MKNVKEVIPVIPSKDIIIGAASAPISITMYGDYESDECARATEVVKELLEIYKGSINFCFRHFPLTLVHQKAHKAAEAAIGAGQEGKFWEMHQYLFTRMNNLGTISLKSYAREVGVTDKKFLEHLINSDWGLYVQDDLREGRKLGIIDIPVFYINKVRFQKEPSLKNFKLHIDGLLKEQRSKVVSAKQKKRA